MQPLVVDVTGKLVGRTLDDVDSPEVHALRDAGDANARSSSSLRRALRDLQARRSGEIQICARCKYGEGDECALRGEPFPPTRTCDDWTR